MSDEKRLSDNEVHDRLVAAERALGDRPASTTRGGTALSAARKALVVLQFGLIKASEENTGKIDCVIEGED